MKPGAFLPLKIPAHGRAGALAFLTTLLCCGPLLSAEKGRFFTGQLLVATEEMKDPRFAESVIYMVNHDAQGAFGLIVNRPVAKGAFEDVLKGAGAETKGAKGEITIHYGGPVGTRQGFMLHSDDVLLGKSAKVGDGIAMTSDVKLLEAAAQGKGPRQFLFMLGYAGWGSGQLESELRAQSWFVVPADKALIFGQDAEKKWRRALDRRRIPL